MTFLLQGETFDVPEVVPFRLTHNMVHGLVRSHKNTVISKIIIMHILECIYC